MADFTQKNSKVIIKNNNGDILQVNPETIASQVKYKSTNVETQLDNVPTFDDTVTTTSNGLAPKVTNTSGFLKGDGTWAVPTNTTYGNATTSGAGLMTAEMVTKLNSIETGANAYTHPTGAGNNHIPSGGSSGQILRWSSNGTASWGADNDTTYAAATTNTLGLVKIASDANITNTGGALSITSANVTSALGYTPPQTDTTYAAGTTALLNTGTDTTDRVWPAKEIASYVDGKISSKLAENDAMIYKGTVSAASGLPASHNAGWAYKATADFTLGSVKVESGDLLICNTDGTTTNNAHWDVIQGNLDGYVNGPAASVSGNIAVFDNTTGNLIADGGKSIAELTYTHPTTAGNKHIPSGGSSGQILRWSANGTATWGADTDTTYAAGTKSQLDTGTDTTNRVWPAKEIADYVKGSLPTIPDVSVTESGSGTLVGSIAVDSNDKHKLIVTKAAQYSHPTTAGNKHIPSGGSSGQILGWSSDGTATWTAQYSHPTGAGNNHIPSGGSSGQILKWSSNGTASWAAEYSYSHPTFTAITGVPTTDVAPGFGGTFNVNQVSRDTNGHVSGITSRKITIPDTAFGYASASAAGSKGLVPAPVTGDQAKFLNAGSGWSELPMYVKVMSVEPSASNTTDLENGSVIFYLTN